jgi:hypothetical protein
MKKKVIKIILILLLPILIIAVVFFIYGSILTLGNQRLETVPISKELKKLEEQVRIETKSGDYSHFVGYAQQEIDNCNALYNIRLSIDNDSIIKEGINDYIKNINYRVKNLIIDKKCIDSIIINVSIKDERNEKGVLIISRYAFPIE